MAAEVLMAVAQRAVDLRERTSDAPQAKKAKGRRLGRPVNPAGEAARQRIRALPIDGLTDATVAARLNGEELTTTTGVP